ncbi:MAG: hypothetical protein ACNYVW_05205 [Methanosarcinales archaeon]
MKEKSIHYETFNVYYALGEKRSLAKLHQSLAKAAPDEKVPALRTLKGWSHSFSWQQQLLNRDKEIGQKVEQRIVRDEVDFRVELLEKLKEEEELYTMQEETAHLKDKDGKPYLREDMQPQTATDLHRSQEGRRKNLELQWRIVMPDESGAGNKVEICIKTVSKLQDKN